MSRALGPAPAGRWGNGLGVDRRSFIKLLGSAALGGTASAATPSEAASYPSKVNLQGARQTTSICPYCAVGCGLLVYTDPESGKIIHIEGDPEHPINQGSLCAKGSALYQMAVNPKRLTKVLHRAPYSDQWEEKSWDWALERIAILVQRTRDNDFEAVNSQGRTVNRTTALAHLGSAALDNEECWLLQAMMRSLGLVYIEHQARI